jgi:hypothetical protein
MEKQSQIECAIFDYTFWQIGRARSSCMMPTLHAKICYISSYAYIFGGALAVFFRGTGGLVADSQCRFHYAIEAIGELGQQLAYLAFGTFPIVSFLRD